MVADIDKNKGIYLVLFTLGINISEAPKSVPKPAKNDKISEIFIFILICMKKRRFYSSSFFWISPNSFKLTLTLLGLNILITTKPITNNIANGINI